MDGKLHEKRPRRPLLYVIMLQVTFVAQNKTFTSPFCQLCCLRFYVEIMAMKWRHGSSSWTCIHNTRT
jgi:hypothetical protein